MQSSEQGVDIGNWRSMPHSAWAFRNVETLIPTAKIERGAPRPVSGQSNPLNGFGVTLQSGRRLDLETFEQATSSDAIVAFVGDELVFESYRNGVTADSRHILMSTSKSITGLIAGILHHRGQMDVEKPVADYVGEVVDTAYAGATIRNLLDMRTGIVLDEVQERRYANASNWDPLSPDEDSIEFLEFIKRLPPSPMPHGGPFKYVSANTDLLGVAIERAAGTSFAEVVSEVLWKPLGAQHDALITLMRGGTPRATGGFCMTTRDFARVGCLLLSNGRLGDNQIVPHEWLDDVLQNGDPSAWSEGEFGQSFAAFGKMSYRSGWYVFERDPKTFFAMGIHGQNLFIDPARNFVLAKFSSQPNPIEQVGLTHLGVAEIRRCLIGS